ncbi:MAG TPA: metallophosphoesterase, partial [Planctomycetota bacterium]|nr:metallophosphoesterase [Planctomycetota bacterium]
MKRRLVWTAWLAGVLFVLCILGCLPLALMARIGTRIHGNGNLPPLRRDDTTRIAVFGDTQKGLAAFAALAERAKAEGVDLAVHTGSLVGHADPGHYDLAESRVRRADLYVPFIVAPGDHDIKGGEGLFEDRIGPRQFAIRWGPVDIIVVDNAVAPPDEGAVERMLASAKGPILLFMHVPPNEPGAKTFTPKPTYIRFLEMIRKRPVRY